jgi:hypothetical protein
MSVDGVSAPSAAAYAAAVTARRAGVAAAAPDVR